MASYWIDTLVLKTEGNTYATLLHHPFLFKGKPTQCSRGSKKDFWCRCRGGLRTSQDIPSTHHKLLSLALLYFPFASRFPLPTSPLPFYPPSLSQSPLTFACLFVCLCVGLLVAMVQDNTKLCDFSNTNNNYFLSTPIAPLNDVESCEINAALLNLVMKDQFSGLPSEDAASHLNNFIDLCDMQKKKDVDNDIFLTACG